MEWYKYSHLLLRNLDPTASSAHISVCAVDNHALLLSESFLAFVRAFTERLKLILIYDHV